jgi:hypothetical protein
MLAQYKPRSDRVWGENVLHICHDFVCIICLWKYRIELLERLREQLVSSYPMEIEGPSVPFCTLTVGVPKPMLGYEEGQGVAIQSS